MKNFFVALSVIIAISINATGYSQVSLPLPGGLRTATQKVLAAYKTQFASIRGDTLSFSKEVEIFSSKVKPDGAVASTLTHYKQVEESLYSWEALMLRTEDFAAASRKYNICCMQLKGISVNTGFGICRFESDYQSTSQNKSFYSTILSPLTNDEIYKNLRLEILMESNITEWTVRVLIYDRDHDDAVGMLQQ